MSQENNQLLYYAPFIVKYKFYIYMYMYSIYPGLFSVVG